MFFDDDAPDFTVVLVQAVLSVLMLVPFLIFYGAIGKAGLLDNIETSFMYNDLKIAVIVLIISYFLFSIVSCESIRDFDVLYGILAIVATLLWMGGTGGVLNTITNNHLPISLQNHEFVCDAEKWYVTLSCITLAVSGFTIVSVFLKGLEVIENGLHNLISLLIFVIITVLFIILMMSGAFKAVQIIIYISLIPCAINVISIIVGWIRGA